MVHYLRLCTARFKLKGAPAAALPLPYNSATVSVSFLTIPFSAKPSSVIWFTRTATSCRKRSKQSRQGRNYGSIMGARCMKGVGLYLFHQELSLSVLSFNALRMTELSTQRSNTKQRDTCTTVESQYPPNKTSGIFFHRGKGTAPSPS